MDEKSPPSAEPGQNGTVGLPSQTGHTPQHRYQNDSLSLAPSKAARNLGVIIDDYLTFTDHIASVSRSCRFALFNISKIRPYLTQYATQMLVQTLVISRFDNCNGPAGMCGETTTDGQERSSASGVQPTEEGTCHPATY